jgi:hypothetical protein
MTLGRTPWIDQDPTNRGPAREQADKNFENLGIGQKSNLFEMLQWPKSNIRVATQTLAKLKNRPNRYPSVNRVDFANDQKAVGVIATEYNSGPTSSDVQSAAPADYGRWAWQNMNDPIIKHFFPNT